MQKNYQHNYTPETLSSNSSQVAGISQVMKHIMKNRPQMVYLMVILNFAKETIVCIRVTHRKSEELSHDIRYNRDNSHGFQEFYALFFARKQIFKLQFVPYSSR